MFHHVTGTLAAKTPAFAVVEAAGVGYLLKIPLSTYENLPARGRPVKLLAHLHVTDDALTLFGFGTEEERRFFVQLVRHVKGVGPRVALAVLSGGRLKHLQQAIRLGDIATLKTIKGLGEATAKRIVLELGKILVQEARQDTAPAAKGRAGQAAAAPWDGFDELTGLAVKAVAQLNEVPHDVALRAVQRAFDALRAEQRPAPSVQELIRRALLFAE